MLYAWIKILHIISSAILFGTGLGTAFYMFYVNQQKNVTLIAKATSNNTPLSAEYQHYFKIWWLLGIPAFIALIGVFYLMANKPEHLFF